MKQLYFIDHLNGEPLDTHIEVYLCKSLIINHILLYFQHAWAPRDLVKLVDDECDPWWSAAIYDVIANARWCKSRERCMLLAQFSPQIISTTRLQLFLGKQLETTADKVVFRANGVTSQARVFSNVPLTDVVTLSQMYPNKRKELDV